MTWAGKIVAWAALVTMVALGAPGAARAQEARDLEARDLFVAGRYTQALTVYQDLYARTHHPTYLRNIGRCHQMLRQPDPAISHFRAYLRDARELAPQERTEIEGYITEMQGLRAVQAPSSPPPPPAAPSPAGTLGAAPDRRERPALTRRWWFWTGLGALVAGSVITAIALSGQNSHRPPCPADTVCP